MAPFTFMLNLPAGFVESYTSFFAGSAFGHCALEEGELAPPEPEEGVVAAEYAGKPYARNAAARDAAAIMLFFRISIRNFYRMLSMLVPRAHGAGGE